MTAAGLANSLTVPLPDSTPFERYAPPARPGEPWTLRWYGTPSIELLVYPAAHDAIVASTSMRHHLSLSPGAHSSSLVPGELCTFDASQFFTCDWVDQNTDSICSGGPGIEASNNCINFFDVARLDLKQVDPAGGF
jgi:hypothetical protein